MTITPGRAQEQGRTLLLVRQCTMCATNTGMYVHPEDYDAYSRGEGHIQDIFPYLAPAERELITNGWCGPCFNSFCPPED